MRPLPRTALNRAAKQYALSVLCLFWILAGTGCTNAGGARVKATETVLIDGASTLELNPSGTAFPFYVSIIDGPKGRRELALAPVNGFYPLDPGLNTLTVRTLVYDYTSPTVDADASTATLSFLALPSVPYSLIGTDDGTELKLSILERNTLHPVTPEVSMPVSRPKTANPMKRWQPVYVPGPTPFVIPIPVE